MDIPDFLLEMSKNINTQDNRITADPLFCVYYDEKIPTAPDYADGEEYYYSDGDYTEIGSDALDLVQWIVENDEDFISSFKSYDHERDDYESQQEYFMECYHPEEDGYPEGVDRFYYLYKKVFVKAALTEKSAQQFIDRKQHDYKKLYIYVESMCYCNEMIELRDWIKGLTENSNAI
jgi:hypothetical protein